MRLTVLSSRCGILSLSGRRFLHPCREGPDVVNSGSMATMHQSLELAARWTSLSVAGMVPVNGAGQHDWDRTPTCWNGRLHPWVSLSDRRGMLPGTFLHEAIGARNATPNNNLPRGTNRG